MSIDVFEFWEKSFSEEQTPDSIDQLIEENEFDAVICAQALQQFIRGRSSSIEAQEADVRKGVDELNFRQLHKYINRALVFNLEGAFEATGLQEAADMMELHNSLKKNGVVEAGGFIDRFVEHSYYDPETGTARPEISILLKDPKFIDGHAGNGRLVTMPNTLTVPVTAIADYKIEERK